MSVWNAGNALLFQGAWFACVLGGARDTSLWGALVLALLAGSVLLREHAGRDLTLAACAAAAGFLLDTLWIHAGVLDYHGARLAPPWIVMLWVGVALTVNHSLSLFHARPLLGGALAGAAAPLSYLAGERLGAVVVPEPWMLGFVSASWALLFAPTFAFAATRLPERHAEKAP